MAVHRERLFPVFVNPGLLDAFEPHVRIIVDLAEYTRPRDNAIHGKAKPIDDLEELLRAWGLLGFSVAMPEQGILGNFPGDRLTVFSSSGFRLTVLRQRTEQRIEWFVDYDAISEAWLDVLLNCLEGFHAQVAPIARVEIASDAEPRSSSRQEAEPSPSGDAGRGQGQGSSRMRKWWPFWRFTLKRGWAGSRPLGTGN